MNCVHGSASSLHVTIATVLLPQKSTKYATILLKQKKRIKTKTKQNIPLPAIKTHGTESRGQERAKQLPKTKRTMRLGLH